MLTLRCDRENYLRYLMLLAWAWDTDRDVTELARAIAEDVQ